MHTSETDNLLSSWHRHNEVLNRLSSCSSVLQRQVKAKEDCMLAGTSAPEHRTIALEVNFVGECCLPPRTGSHQETELLTQHNDLLQIQLLQQIFLPVEVCVFAEKLSAVFRGKNTEGITVITHSPQ